jgi:capsular polysaccharide transport system permease protein
MNDDQDNAASPIAVDDRHKLSDQRIRSDLPETIRERRSRGRELARKPILPATAPPAAAPPAEATPFSWVGSVQPDRMWLELKHARRRRLFFRLGIFCALPTIFTFLYMLFIASPRYVSEFEITYQTYNPPQTLSSGLVQNLLGSNATNGALDLADILYEYIRSATLLQKLDHELRLRQYYSSPTVDYFSRMNPNATINTFQLYYNWFVSVSQSNGYLTIDVQAFDPDYALALAKAIVKACDQMVNELTARPSQDEVRYAKAEVKEAEDRVRKARQALTEFQNAHGDLNPPGSANQLGGIVGTIEGSLAAARSQLAVLAATAPNSPQVKVTKANIAALEGQLKLERDRLANNRLANNDLSTVPYSKLLNQYQALQLEQQFAQTAYQAAQQGLEVARADAIHQQNYLIDFAPPYRPDRQSIKFALWYTLTALTISLALFAIGSLIGGAMRDQSVQ